MEDVGGRGGMCSVNLQSGERSSDVEEEGEEQEMREEEKMEKKRGMKGGGGEEVSYPHTLQAHGS